MPATRASRFTGRLTPRQCHVLRLLCLGKTNKMIGRELGISPATVKIHVGHVLRMLNVTTRLAAVAELQRRGVLLAPGAVPTRAPWDDGMDRRLVGARVWLESADDQIDAFDPAAGWNADSDAGQSHWPELRMNDVRAG